MSKRDVLQRAWIVLAVVVALVGCGGGEEGASTAPLPTTTPADGQLPTATPVPPTATAAPATATRAPAGSAPRVAVNAGIVQESGGLRIELRRAVIAERAFMESELGASFVEASLEPEAFESAELVGEFILALHNGSDKVLSVYPDQCTVLVQTTGGVRQVDVVWESVPVAGLDDVSGEIHPDVRKIGGFWYPISRVALADVQGVALRFDAASDEEFEKVGEDWAFEIDLSGRPDEPLTDSVTVP